MSKELTRANEFDRRMGSVQTEFTMELAVGESLLDIGCGFGEFTPMFLKKFKKVVGLDPDKKMIDVARSLNKKVDYRIGWGETFSFEEKFDTISMNNLLEHVDDPAVLLENCAKHLSPGGRIIAQVPNSESVTRRLGVLMGMIDNTDHISEKERDFFGHQRVYTLGSLVVDAKKAGLVPVDFGGLLYKPLPNVMLEKICLEQGETWTDKFIDALIEYGKTRPKECGYLYIVCEK